MQSTKSIPSVERALAILELLDASNGRMNISDLSRKLEIPRSSAHVITLTLERCGYITRNGSHRNCQIAAKAFHLGRAAFPAEHLARVAVAPMRELSALTNHTSHLAVIDQNQPLYVQKVRSAGQPHFDTHAGKHTNFHCTAIGKALLSYASKEYQDRILSQAPFARYTRNSIVQASALREELARIAANGYALDNQEEELDVACAAVPVFNHRGEVIAALSITSTAPRLKTCLEKGGIGHLQRISRRIGLEVSPC